MYKNFLSGLCFARDTSRFILDDREPSVLSRTVCVSRQNHGGRSLFPQDILRPNEPYKGTLAVSMNMNPRGRTRSLHDADRYNDAVGNVVEHVVSYGLIGPQFDSTISFTSPKLGGVNCTGSNSTTGLI